MTRSREYVLTISAFSCMLLTGCFFPPPDLEVQVIHYPGFEHHESRVEPCEDVQALSKIHILAVDELRPEGCRQIGDVFIGDSSTSYPCEPEDLIERFRLTACLEGAAMTQIIHITSPRDGQSCHQLRAALLICE
jgi:hypothetical protein